MKNVLVKTRATACCAFLLSLSLSACQNTTNTSQENELRSIHQKLGSIENQLKTLSLARPAKAPSKPRRPTPGLLYRVPVTDADSYRGGAHAKVTIVEATEYACPYCAKLAKINDELLDVYDDDDLKIVSKSFVIHPDTAMSPALASCAAKEQGQFASFDKVLWTQAWFAGGSMKFDRKALADKALEKIALTLGLDMEKFKIDAGETCKKRIQAQRVALSTLGVTGTPSIYVNGVFFGGPRTTDGLKSAIDAALVKTNQALEQGGEVKEYYTKLVEEGKIRM